MSLLSLLIIISVSLAIGLISSSWWRRWALLVASVLVIYWLQPATPIRHLDFWLPTFCLILVVIVWSVTRSKESSNWRSDLVCGLVITALVLLVGLPRYLGTLCCLTPSQPPVIQQVFLVLLAATLFSLLLAKHGKSHIVWVLLSLGLILVLFIVLKSDILSKYASMGLRIINDQSPSLASGLDIRWLGFSYIAFRLIHTLRDRLSGKLPSLTLQEFVIYVIFFPAISAGPIDRVQHFSQELSQPFNLTMDKVFLGGKRILFGIFNKFVIADGLALIALNNTNTAQVTSPGWSWVLLYAFALRIYFDFSGYTDIAIGMGHLMGIQLPENFEHPYLKRNLTSFWNSWHMTLAGWFRAYFFNPLTRALRSRETTLPMPVIIFIGQLSTFTLIGLWHGITWNFAIWGLWHGVGLFIHNRWSDLLRTRPLFLDTAPRLKWLTGILSTVLTFHYVSLGWVWFALSTPDQSLKTLLKLFGFS